LRLLLEQYAAAEREARMEGLLDQMQRGELDPAGLLVTEDLRGAVLATPLAGAGGLVWPPVCPCLAEAQALVEAAVAWLRTQGTRIVQALVSLPEASPSNWLEECGFQGVTQLWTLARDTKSPLAPAKRHVWPPLHYEPFDPNQCRVFEATLQATYIDSLDCPEVNGLRSAAEILAGHRMQGEYEPTRWWLVRQGTDPVGVVIQVDHPPDAERELAYVGLVPTARGRGLGYAILARVIECTAREKLARVVLGVDARNQPALRLYQAAGFTEVQRQQVYLRVEL
jgi:mycothiol synthase